MNYNEIINKNIQAIPPSGIRKYFDILNGMDGCISLGIGEPDFVTPWHIRDAGITSLKKGYTKYTPNAGFSELRREIANYQKRRMGLEYDPNGEIIVTVGGSEAIDLALRCLLNPSDEVIVPTPSFVCYGPLGAMAQATPVYVECKAENEFRLTAKELKEAITPKTKVLIMPFPNNPTGAIMRKQDLEDIAEALKGTDIMVISDEIYCELTYGAKHVSIASIPGMRERTVVVNGFSKSYSMTGWRMGYLLGPREIIAAVTKLHQYGIMSAPTMSQYASIEALKNGDNDIEKFRDEYNSRRKFLLNGLRKLGLSCFEAQGAFYLFPCIRSTGLSSDDFCMGFLQNEKVAVIPGNAFGDGGEGFVRICYANSMANLKEALARLERYLKSIK